MYHSVHGEIPLLQRQLSKLTELFNYQYSAAMEHCPFVSGNPERRGACKEISITLTTLAGLYSLEADRREGSWSRRCIRYVPDRYRQQQITNHGDG